MVPIMNVLLIGAPGSGKSTQGDRLSQRLGLEHIAAGDRLRAEATAGTPLGKEIATYLDRGELVPDQLVIDLILPAVLAAAQRNGYILEGFPRSVGQATRALAGQAGAGPDVVIFLDAPRDVLIERTLARAHAEGRSDDTEDVVTRRHRVFDEVTRPLVDYYYYRSQGLLHTVDASQNVDDVTRDILSALEP